MIRRRPTASLAAAGALLLSSLLAGCAGNDPHYTLKDIKGLVSPLEFR